MFRAVSLTALLTYCLCNPIGTVSRTIAFFGTILRRKLRRIPISMCIHSLNRSQRLPTPKSRNRVLPAGKSVFSRPIVRPTNLLSEVFCIISHSKCLVNTFHKKYKLFVPKCYRRQYW